MAIFEILANFDAIFSSEKTETAKKPEDMWKNMPLAF